MESVLVLFRRLDYDPLDGDAAQLCLGDRIGRIKARADGIVAPVPGIVGPGVLPEDDVVAVRVLPGQERARVKAGFGSQCF